MTTTAATEAAPPSGSAFAIGMLVAVGVLVCWPAAEALYQQWTISVDRSHRHGFLIVALSGWRLVHALREPPGIRPQPVQWWIYAALVATSVSWAVCWRAGIQDGFLLLTPPLLWLTVLSAAGWPAARAVAFPLAFLYFAMPIWSSLAYPLQVITANVVHVVIGALGIPSQLEGVVIRIPEGAFEVGAGCSGSHYLTVGLALAALTGEFERVSLRRRVVFLAAMGLAALVSNWLRVATIVVAGHLTDMQHFLITRDHYWFGWALFGAAFFIFLYFSMRGPLAPRKEMRAAGEPAQQLSHVPYLAAVVAMGGVPVAAYVVSTIDRVRSEPLVIRMPANVDRWSGPFTSPHDDWSPRYIGAGSQTLATYVGGGGRLVQMYVVAYSSQRQDAELVNWSNSLVGPRSQSVDSQASISVSGVRMQETVSREADGARSIIWSVYDIGGRSFVESLPSQLWYGTHALLGTPRSALIAFRTSCLSSCVEAQGVLRGFVESAGPAALHLR